MAYYTRALVLFFVVLSNSWTLASETTRMLAIPLQSIKKPASDLVYKNETLEVGDAAKLEEGGFDLSTLNPIENKMWQNQSYSATDESQRNYPSAQVGVRFLSFEAATKFTSMARVQSSSDSNTYFRLALSRYSQPMMMRAALLRKLGYFIPSPKYYKNLKVIFSSEAEKKDFLNQAAQDVSVDFESRKWISNDDPKEHSVVLASATLESMSSDFFDLNWGLAPNPDFPSQVPLVQRFSRNRAYRALIFPYSLVDVPESINRISTRFATISSGYITIPYMMAQSFGACTMADARWLLQRLAKLSLQDFKEVVQQGHYPAEMEPLVLAKIVNRANDALKVFGVRSNIQDLDVNISSASGLVKDGKVTQELTEGYPQRFSHGERTSPYQSGDLTRLLSIDGKSSVLATAITRLNEKLQVVTMQDAAEKYSQQYRARIIDHIRNHPNEPFHQEVTSWGGPLFGFNVRSSRHVSTGTFSGSTAPVQLVDNISLSADMGLFRALDGVDKTLPMGGANVSVVRDYTHVRPILSIKEAAKVEWNHLLVPYRMKKLVEVLDSTEQKTKEGLTQFTLDGFLNDLRDGEVFTISDSVALSTYLRTSSSLDVLLGIQPLDFLNSITMGADAGRVIIRQTSFHRVVNERFNGVHVYVREMKNKSKGLEMNVNYFFNLLKVRAQATDADIKTDGFVVDYNPALAAQTDPQSPAGQRFQQTRENLRLALQPLFRDNETEILYAKFQNKRFQVAHDLKNKETKLKFLAWRLSQFQEDHLVEIMYPPSEKHPDLKPEDEKVTLFTSKKGELKGRDLLGFFYDLLDGVLINKSKQSITISRGMGDNPANAPMGKAYWRLINTEADLSQNIDQYPSVSMIQHVWGGWSLTREKFFKVIDEIKEHFENTEIAGYDLINKSEFSNVKSLDFYRITANLSVLEVGLHKIRDLILQPKADALNPTDSKFPLERLIYKIRCSDEEEKQKERCQKKKIRYANDQELFQELLKILGDGDLNKGKESYMEICEIEQSRRPGRTSGSGTDFYKGTRYECLSRWVRKLIDLGHRYPADKQGQTRWMTEVLSILDEQIPLPQLLKYLGQENYIFLIRINGFRAGDEDGDLEYFSNTIGDPAKDYSTAGGLINMYIKKTGLMPTELDRTLGGFQ